jgi:hypothetical protein
MEYRVYELLGLRVRAPFALASRSTTLPPDVDVSVDREQEVPAHCSEGEILAELVHEGAPWYTATATEAGFTVRCHGSADFHISRDFRSIRCHFQPGVDSELASLLLRGTVAAFVLQMNGVCLLHASAVAVEGSTVAFVGSSGMGKSTLCALACADGATLVADDVLRVDFGSELVCTGDASEIRLRPAALPIVEGFDPRPTVRTTGDGRVAVRPLRVDQAGRRLAAIVIPVPSKNPCAVSVNRVAGAEAVLRLAEHPRIHGWRHPPVLETTFRQLAEIARRVPVFDAHVPWGPPFDDSLAARILAATDATA